MKTVLPELEKLLEPAYHQARVEILRRVAGPTPAGFTERALHLFRFDQAQVDALWQAAVDAAAG
jgi:hypothetical protein